MQNPGILAQVTQASIQLILHEPFYGYVLMGLVKELDERIPGLSLGVNANKTPQLSINPQYWEKELPTLPQRIGALKHEVLHLVLGHLLRGRDFAQVRLFHLAADLVVNQYLSPEQVPVQTITLNELPELELPPFRSLDFYYKELETVWNKTLRRGQVISPELSKRMEAGIGALPEHGLWAELLEQLSAAERKVYESTVQNIVQNAWQRIGSKGQGNLPRELCIALSPALQAPTTTQDWRRILRLFAGAGQRTFLQNTLRKPSRRYGVNPGIRIRNKHKLLVILDTSASVADEAIQAFFQEIQQTWRLGAEISILECDTQINNVYLYRGKTPKVLSGRGGTHFDAALKYANQQSNANALLYFTDGMGPAPLVQCRKPLLWVIVGKASVEHLPGRKILI